MPPPPWSMAEPPRGAARGCRRKRRRAAPGSDRFPAAPPFLPLGRAADAPAPGPGPAPGRRWMGSSPACATSGQLHRTYLVCEAPGELVLVDQHAAHERVAFQRLRAAHRAAGRRPPAACCSRIAIELDEPAAAAAARARGGARCWPAWASSSRRSGGRRLVLRAVPELLKDADPKPLLLDVLCTGWATVTAARAGGRGGWTTSSPPWPATASCARAIVLGREEARGPAGRSWTPSICASHCPHGRPVLLRMALSELERALAAPDRPAASRPARGGGPGAHRRRARARWGWRWPRALGGEILCCDSMQVYRGMDIGTAKPTAGRAGAAARITCSTWSTPASPFTPPRWAERARAAIAARRPRAGGCPSSSAAPGSTSGRWCAGCSRPRRPIPSIRARHQAEARPAGWRRCTRAWPSVDPGGGRAHPAGRSAAHQPRAGGATSRPASP